MKTVSEASAAGLLRPYGITLSSYMHDKIAAYIDILARWNAKISLTTVTDPVEILTFHFGESLFASSCISLQQGRLADVGTGAGFPGLPLAIAHPTLQVTLIDSNSRKAAFLAEVTRRLGLTNVKIVRSRMAEFDSPEPFDFVTSRAFGQFVEFLKWSRENLRERGQVILWLGEKDLHEVNRFPGWKWKTPVRIPNSAHRYVLAGETEQTDAPDVPRGTFQV
jgi:16S rRNA (guanine527-N7)-methyltransferase